MGVDWNFVGVIALRTEWTTQHEKQLMANQAAKLARQLGAPRGVAHLGTAGGNEFIEVVAHHPGVRSSWVSRRSF